MKKEVKIRRLTHGDTARLAKLVVKLAGTIGNSKMLSLMSADSQGDGESAEGSSGAYVAIGLQIFTLLLEHLTEDLEQWSAELCGLSAEEFQNGPCDIQLQVIAQVLESEDAEDFFTSALHVRNVVRSFQGKFKNK